jgi:hypothetical protein
MRGFAVFNDGIDYLHPSGENRYEICFYEFAEGRSRVAAEIEGRLFLGFTVTPDRKTFVFSKWTDAGSDLMLIDRFR